MDVTLIDKETGEEKPMAPQFADVFVKALPNRYYTRALQAANPNAVMVVEVQQEKRKPGRPRKIAE